MTGVINTESSLQDMTGASNPQGTGLDTHNKAELSRQLTAGRRPSALEQQQRIQNAHWLRAVQLQQQNAANQDPLARAMSAEGVWHATFADSLEPRPGRTLVEFPREDGGRITMSFSTIELAERLQIDPQDLGGFLRASELETLAHSAINLGDLASEISDPERHIQ